MSSTAGWFSFTLSPSHRNVEAFDLLTFKKHAGSALARMEVVKKVSIEFVKIIPYDVVIVIHIA